MTGQIGTKTDTGTRTIEDAICVACGCLCDDVGLSVNGGRIVAAERACELGQKWFLDRAAGERPGCRIEGEPVALDRAVQRAAEILGDAKYPLVFGLAGATCEAQRHAAAIADSIGGNIDPTTGANDAAVIRGLQHAGQVTCTLGEAAARADLVIFFAADPARTHPRHFERYSLSPKGLLVPRGREDRTCIVIDEQETKTAGQAADLLIRIAPGRGFEALWTLRALAKGRTPDERRVERATGAPLAAWQDVVERMKACTYGVVFFGDGVTSAGPGSVEALFLLVREMNAHSRFACLGVGRAGNATGAENVLAWRTGFPLGVNLSRGYPRFGPGEFTAVELLARGEADAALVVSGDPLSGLPRPAREHLARIPLVALAPRETATARAAAVTFTVATFGIDTPGTVFRTDGVPLRLRPAFDPPHPTACGILAALADALDKQRTATV